MAGIPGIAYVTAYARLDLSVGDGFVLPLLRAESREGWLIQEADEGTDLVISFRTLDSEITEIGRIPEPVPVRVGSPQVYAFIQRADINLGTKATLEPILRASVQQTSTSSAVAHQVYEMVGSMTERQSARLQMKGVIEKALGSNAARAFVENSLASAFWTRISRAWRLSSNPNRRDELRSRFRVFLEPDGSIQVENVAALDAPEFELLQQIIVDLEAEFKGAESLPEAGGPSSPTLIAEDLAKIEATVRQEERISLLLAEILGNRENGSRLLRAYQPRAAFERIAIARMRDNFPSGNDSMFEGELMVSKLIYTLFSDSFPLNRGHLLRYLSKHLAMYHHINRTIELKLNESRSMVVENSRKEIISNLDRYR